MLTVKDILEKKGDFVATVGADSTILEAAKEMNSKRIGALVVTEGKRVIGIFSERDILTRVTVAQLDLVQTTVGDVMTRRVSYCKPESKVEECRSIMTVKRVRHLPVIKKDCLVGIVTIGDLLAAEFDEQERTIEYLNQYIHGPYTMGS